VREQTRGPALSVRDVTKRFGANVALDGVSLDVAPGSVHALVGLNGSGKSTLVKVLSGFHDADEGVVEADGVAFVHQDLGLLPPMTVLENMALGKPLAMRWGQIDWPTEAMRARQALAPFGMDHLLQEPVSSLSMAQQAVVALAKALAASSGEELAALVLDEPTSALPNHEIELLAAAMRQCAADGIGIIFITHRLQEVVELADHVTVLRNGQVVLSSPTAGLGVDEMVRAMVGDASSAVSEERPAPAVSARPVLRTDGVRGGRVEQLSLELYAGEIVGVFGMAGSGVEHVGALLSGRQAPEAGTVTLDGRPLRPFSRVMDEVGYVPSDRGHRGVFPGLSVRENMSVRTLGRTLRRGGISLRTERSLASRWTADLKIKPLDPEVTIGSLSGGNQQKAVLGRWLAVKPKVIVAEEPTQGIDVWAKAQILRRLRAATDEGAAVLLTAVEPEEILHFCDRIVVLRRGRRVLDGPRSAVGITDILSAMH
jgi:ABC-type sugar transport system ATPase subunit